MKKWIGLALVFAVASIGAARAAFMSFSIGSHWGTTQIEIYSVYATDENVLLQISSDQTTTGDPFPSFRQNGNPEPAGGASARAFEFVISSVPWALQNNSIFVVENGVGGPPNFVDVFGNFGVLVNNVNANRILWAKYENITPVDGDFAFGIMNSLGWVQFSSSAISYTADGAPGADNDFDLVISDGFTTHTLVLPCTSGGAILNFAQLSSMGWPYPGGSVITLSFANTGDCAAVPTIRSFFLYSAYTGQPP